MRHKPGDFYMFFKEKQAEPWDWNIPVTSNSWGDWAKEQWGNLKGLFGGGTEAAAAARPVNTGSLMQRLSKLPSTYMEQSNPQYGTTAPNAGLWRARMSDMANPVESTALQSAQSLRPPSMLSRAGTGLANAGAYLGKSFLTGATQSGMDSLSRKGVENLTGGSVDEGAAGNLISRGIGLAAPALKMGPGLALSALPAVGRLGGAAAGNAWASMAPSALGGNGQAAEFGPAAQNPRHLNITQPPKTLEESHKRDAFSTSFGPGWNDGKTEMRPVQPLR